MITVRRMLDDWRRAVAAHPVEALRDALAGSIDDAFAERVCMAAILEPELVRTTLGPLADAIGSTQPGGAEILNALACVGATVNRALELREPAGVTVRALRDQHDPTAALISWRALVASCQQGEAGAALLLLGARVAVHEIGGKPLESIAVWVRDTLERQAKLQEHAAAEDRERMRLELVEDPDRLRSHPEARLAACQQAARPVAALVDHGADDLGRELARSVLVDPHQATDAARLLVDRLTGLAPATPEARLSVCDAVNALACVGVEIPQQLERRIVEWLPALTTIGPPLSVRIRVGLAALAYGRPDLAQQLAPQRPGNFVGGLAFPHDMLAVLGYAIAADRVHAVSGTLDPTMQRIGEQLDELCAGGQLDEPTVLWLARFVFHRLDRQPLAGIAARAHEWLWRVPHELDEARGDAVTRAPRPPIGQTIAGGRFRIERWLLGSGSQRLYRGVEVSTGAHVLVALDDHSPRRQSIDELRAAISYAGPGLFALAFAGALDADPARWCVVERVPAGSWLPDVLGPADPWTGSRKAVQLGLSAGAILDAAAAAGVVLADIRPELMWAERTGDRIAVTGLSTRAIELFRRHRGDAVTRPIFEHSYRAPEPDADEQAVTFALAAMISEWATGQHPLQAGHDSAGLTGRLSALLARAMQPGRESRPSPRQFITALSQLADD